MILELMHYFKNKFWLQLKERLMSLSLSLYLFLIFFLFRFFFFFLFFSFFFSFSFSFSFSLTLSFFLSYEKSVKFSIKSFLADKRQLLIIRQVHWLEKLIFLSLSAMQTKINIWNKNFKISSNIKSKSILYMSVKWKFKTDFFELKQCYIYKINGKSFENWK